jgi:RNA polymerase sigma-70 factor (ECF subfamily)
VIGDDFPSVLRAAQSGGEWAVAALYRAHQARILRYLRAQAPGHEEDLASETWLAAARNLRSFDGDEDAFAGWLFTIAHRRLLDHRRALRRRPTDLHEPARLEPYLERRGSAEDDLLTGALADEEAARLVAVLTPEQAEVLLLRVVGGLSAEAVGHITGRRPGTVRVIQHRALERLAAHLGDGRNDREEGSDGTDRDAHAPTSPRRRHR